jgi:tRNA threonylcarbamoyl adenosine modification protein YjeE
VKETVVVSHSQEETEGIAAQMARTLQAPQVIALIGDLGAGKTTFVRAFVGALMHGDKARVKSPSFALHHEYATSPVCHHMDLYRLSDARQFEDLGLREIVDAGQGIVIIEWPEIIEPQLPANTIKIRFKELSEQSREITITFSASP